MGYINLMINIEQILHWDQFLCLTRMYDTWLVKMQR